MTIWMLPSWVIARRPARRGARPVIEAPGRDGVVDVLEHRNAAHEERQHPEHDPAGDGDGERDRQQEAAGDLTIEAPRQQACHCTVGLDRLADGLRRLRGRPCRHPRPRVPAAREKCEEAGAERHE